MSSGLKFINYIVEKVEFKNNFKFEDEIEIDFDINKDIEFINKNKFFLKLSLELFKKNIEKSPFSMTIDIIGIFEIGEDEDEKNKDNLIKVNSVAILFPYIRAIVSNYTALANINPLLLPPINIIDYLKKKELQE